MVRKALLTIKEEYLFLTIPQECFHTFIKNKLFTYPFVTCVLILIKIKHCLICHFIYTYSDVTIAPVQSGIRML